MIGAGLLGFSLATTNILRAGMFTTGLTRPSLLAVMAQLDRQLTPEIYAVGTTTTVFLLIAVLFCTSALWAMRRSTSYRKA